MDTVNWEFIKYNNLNNLLGVSRMTNRKSYDKEFKLEAVQLVESGKRVAEVVYHHFFAILDNAIQYKVYKISKPIQNLYGHICYRD